MKMRDLSSWKMQQSFDSGMEMKVSFQPGRENPQTYGHGTFRGRYIDGWLEFKDTGKFKKYWFVLKGDILAGSHLMNAYLFRFKDQNTHVKDHLVGEVKISTSDDIELYKIEGNESNQWKCEFTIKLNEERLCFRAVDNISRERWIYALIDLVAEKRPPSDLPTLNNQIRTRKQFIDRRFSLPILDSIPTYDIPIIINPSPNPSPYNPSFKRDELSLTVPWYHRGMDRGTAHSLLSTVGSYLLRDHKEDKFVLTYKDEEKYMNLLISKNTRNGEYSFNNTEILKESFASPEDGVIYYMELKQSRTFRPKPVQRKDSDYLFHATPEPPPSAQGPQYDRPLPDLPRRNSRTDAPSSVRPREPRTPLSRQPNIDQVPVRPPQRKPLRTSKSTGTGYSNLTRPRPELRRSSEPCIKPNDLDEKDDDYYPMALAPKYYPMKAIPQINMKTRPTPPLPPPPPTLPPRDTRVRR